MLFGRIDLKWMKSESSRAYHSLERLVMVSVEDPRRNAVDRYVIHNS